MGKIKDFIAKEDKCKNNCMFLVRISIVYMFMYKLKRIGYSTLLYIKSKGLKLKSQWNENKYILKEIRSPLNNMEGSPLRPIK